jgi:hypothetical protein
MNKALLTAMEVQFASFLAFSMAMNEPVEHAKTTFKFRCKNQ